MTKNRLYDSMQCPGVVAFALLVGLGLGITPAARGDAAESLTDLDCVIEPNVVVDVGSPSAGVVEEVLVDRSERVEFGQVIARLDDGVEQATVDLARTKASLTTEERIRETTLGFEERRQARAGELFKRKVVAEQAVDEARRDARVSNLQLRQARENRQLAELESRRADELLARRTVRSPVSGVVVERFKHGGEFVEDEPIMRIAQLDPLRVEVIVAVEQFGQITPGMRARIVPELPSARTHQAIVSVVDNVLDAASGTFGVRLELPNPDHRLPGGLRCRVSFLEEAPVAIELDDTTSPLGAGLDSEARLLTGLPTETAAELDPPLAGAEEVESVMIAAGPDGELSLPTESPTGALEILDALLPDATDVEPGSGAAEHRTATVASLEFTPDQQHGSPPPSAMVEEGELARAARLCRTIGPLESEADVRTIEGVLEDIAKEIHRREVVDSVPEGYAVFAARSELEAGVQTLMRRLQGLGVEDVLVSGRKNGEREVLLGFYRNRDNVDRRQSTLQGLGIQVEVRPRLREAIRIWLDIELEGDLDVLTVQMAGESVGISLPLSAKPCS